MEEELLRARKLESLAILAGGIAHDFNNLLSVIIGHVSLARLYPDPTNEISTHLEKTEKACFQMRDLVQQLMLFTGYGKQYRKPQLLQSLIPHIVEGALKCSNMEYTLDFSDDLRPVNCDPHQICSLLNHLLTNSMEAMHKDCGLIEIILANEDLPEDNSASIKPGRYVKLSIRDDGRGIPKEHLDKIFDPYFSTKERGAQKGMGLGLATAYSIVRGHCGHISVESEPGVGTVFHIHLPAVTQDVDRERNNLQPLKQ
jgi:signal transduction histidine kinase